MKFAAENDNGSSDTISASDGAKMAPTLPMLEQTPIVELLVDVGNSSAV